MRTLFKFFTRISLIIFLFFPYNGVQLSDPRSHPSALSQPVQVGLQADYGKMALTFIENQGQADPQVAFTILGNDKTIYFTETGLTFVFSQKPKTPDTKLIAR